MSDDDLQTRRSLLQQLALFAGGIPLLASRAHAGTDTRRIGYFANNYPQLMNAFLDELRSLGFADGQNITVEKRIPGAADDPAAMAKELAAMKLEFVVAAALPFALMVRNANPDMPMVIGTCPGMISNGFAHSLAHPAGLYTGMEELPPGLTGKRLRILNAAVPAARRIALLSTTPGVGGHETQLEDAKHTAEQLGLVVKPYRASTTAEVETALAAMAGDQMEGLVNFQGGLSLGYRQRIVDFAADHRLPAIYQATMFADAGGLLTWAPDLTEQFRTAARLAARILQGAKPGDLPVEYPKQYFLTVNVGAAKKIGLELPPALLAQAARVIT